MAALLVQHGVAEAEAVPRSQALLARLGAEALQQAVSCSAPWKQLKAVAWLAKPPIQLILPSELQQQINLRAQQAAPGGGRGRRKKQGFKDAPASAHPGELKAPLPAQVAVPAGIFVHAASGKELQSISLADVGPKAEGIVLVTPAEALPYLALSAPLSSEALALLVIGDVSLATVTLQHAQVRCQATCRETGEPMLLNASLVQLGAQTASKAAPATVAPLELTPSELVRVAVFKDQWSGCWESFAQGPLKAVIQACPALQTCSEVGCTCAAWHGVHGPGEPAAVLEAFGRQFLDEGYRTSPPTEAFVWNVFLRVPSELSSRLQPFSGIGGVFFEPRGREVRLPSDRFTVVWLPRAGLQDAVLRKQAQPEVLGLARVGQRYGLRCLSAHAMRRFAQNPLLLSALEPRSFIPGLGLLGSRKATFFARSRRVDGTAFQCSPSQVPMVGEQVCGGRSIRRLIRPPQCW